MNRRRIYINLAFLFVISIVLLSAPAISQRRSFAKNPASLLNGSIDLKNALAAAGSYDLAFSTYLGGSGYEHARDVFVDAQGYIYVAGGTASPDFPTTFGPAFNSSPCATLGSAGRMDIFVAKFDPNGGRVWSRLLGGPCYDRAYGIEVDNQGYIYIAGRAGEDFPTTAGVFQPDFQGNPAGPYGTQNAFVARLASDGSLVWASYAGVGQNARDIAIDSNRDIYIPLTYNGAGGVPPTAWFSNAFQKTLQGGTDNGVLKIKNDGMQVLWATWLGGSSDESQAASIRVDVNNNNVYLGMRTQSTDMPTTPGAFDQTYNGGWDYYVARLSSDGSSLIFGTYLGGVNDEGVATHTLALDNLGNVYASPWTNSPDFPTTQGAIQTAFGGGIADITVVKLSPTGALLNSTYIGGSGTESVEGIYVDDAGNVFTTGLTGSTNFPTTSNAYKSYLSGGEDAVLIMLSADFSHLIYSTFMGGSSNDTGRAAFIGQDGSLYIAGQTDGGGWPTLNAFQNYYAGGPLDAVLAKFTASKTATSTPSPTNTPLPTATSSTPEPSSTPTAPPVCTIFIPIVRKPE